MWPFRMRADPEEKTEQAAEDSLLSAMLSDEQITAEQAMNIPAFAGCVNLICDAVSVIPIKLYRIENGRKTEIEGDKRVSLINQDTGDTLSGVQFKRAMVRDYLIGKGAYAFIQRVGSQVESLHYVDNAEVSFMYSADPIFKDYDILVQGISYAPYEFLKILRNSKNGWSGRSIVEENRQMLSVAYYSLLYEKILVKTGGNKKGFIKSENVLTDKAVKMLKDAWRRLYQNNTENVVVLNKGLDFKESSNTSVEMQLNENKRTNAEAICNIFKISPNVLTGNATEADKIAFFENCINPILEECVCSLNRDLLKETEKGQIFFAADSSEQTKGDIEKRYKAYEIAGRNGFMQIDEIRFRENLPPLNLDFVKLGLQDVLYYPKTQDIFIPNMNSSGNLRDGGAVQGAAGSGNAEGKEGEKIENEK